MTTLSRRAEFADHIMTAGPGWSWRLAKPGTSIYAYRVTWAPGVLLVSGDIGELVVSHHSFNEPWNAAAWARGADFDYFMSKTSEQKEYDEEATKDHIVSTAYERLRQGASAKLMERIVEEYGGGDLSSPEDRKDACRRLLDSDLSEHDAWQLSPEDELPWHHYTTHHERQHNAIQIWAELLWRSEPMWHVCIRRWRELRAAWRRLSDGSIVWEPIRYVSRGRDGRVTTLNGAQYWMWRRGRHAHFVGLTPLKIGGHDLSRLGFWRVQGSTWSEEPHRPRYSFHDVRPGEGVR